MIQFIKSGDTLEKNLCGVKQMKIGEICRILDAKVLCGQELMDTEVSSACGSDMMSDVLAFVKNHAILLTGLLNPQTVRTAMMMDMKCIIFVRGKTPDESMVSLAQDNGIVMMTTDFRMYTACGLLYNAGLYTSGSDKV